MNTQPDNEWPPFKLWHMTAAKEIAPMLNASVGNFTPEDDLRLVAATIARNDPGDHVAAIAQDIKRRNYELIDQRNELIAALKGARRSMRKALPYLPPDNVAIYVGEWVDEINEALDRQGVARE